MTSTPLVLPAAEVNTVAATGDPKQSSTTSSLSTANRNSSSSNYHKCAVRETAIPIPSRAVRKLFRQTAIPTQAKLQESFLETTRSPAAPATVCCISMTPAAAPAASAARKRIKIVHISDTHCKRYALPDGDLLIHSGDFTTNGLYQENNGGEQYEDEVKQFVKWWDELAAQYQYRVLVPGNHEMGLDQIPLETLKEMLHCCAGTNGSGALRNTSSSSSSTNGGINCSSAFLLVDESVTLFNGQLKIYGSPWTNAIGMAWGAPQEERTKRYLQHLPHDVDILVTHTPPLRCLDGPARHGCKALHELFRSRNSPLSCDSRAIPLHLFGHVHENNGVKIEENPFLLAPSTAANTLSSVACSVSGRPDNTIAAVNAIITTCLRRIVLLLQL